MKISKVFNDFMGGYVPELLRARSSCELKLDFASILVSLRLRLASVGAEQLQVKKAHNQCKYIIIRVVCVGDIPFFQVFPRDATEIVYRKAYSEKFQNILT